VLRGTVAAKRGSDLEGVDNRGRQRTKDLGFTGYVQEIQSKAIAPERRRKAYAIGKSRRAFCDILRIKPVSDGQDNRAPFGDLSIQKRVELALCPLTREESGTQNCDRIVAEPHTLLDAPAKPVADVKAGLIEPGFRAKVFERFGERPYDALFVGRRMAHEVSRHLTRA
jgi:hypothetical protein